jgi:hypothetical protein
VQALKTTTKRRRPRDCSGSVTAPAAPITTTVIPAPTGRLRDLLFHRILREPETAASRRCLFRRHQNNSHRGTPRVAIIIIVVVEHGGKKTEEEEEEKKEEMMMIKETTSTLKLISMVKEARSPHVSDIFACSWRRCVASTGYFLYNYYFPCSMFVTFLKIFKIINF